MMAFLSARSLLKPCRVGVGPSQAFKVSHFPCFSVFQFIIPFIHNPSLQAIINARNTLMCESCGICKAKGLGHKLVEIKMFLVGAELFSYIFPHADSEMAVGWFVCLF